MQSLSFFRKSKDTSLPHSNDTSPVEKADQSVPENNDLTHTMSRQTTTSSRRKPPKWWRVYWFRGMWRDVKRRAPFYGSDFLDAWDYRVIPATIYMYFANILPALAFSLDMFDRTHNSYGVNEVLLSSFMASFIFSLFAAQPLTIVGVTGPITVFSYTVYDIIVPTGSNFFAFMALIGLWSLAMHWFLAISNSCNGLRYVTRFSCDTFGFYVALIYLQKGVQVLTRQLALGQTSLYLSIMVSLLVLIVAYGCGIIGGSSLFQRYVRKFIEDYGTPLTIIFFTGFVHIGHMRSVNLQTLPTSRAFFPTADRGWFVDFWDIKARDVGISFPFAVILTILFWFDHNVSSLIAQGTEFPLRKPAGFHWDIFLLGLTTGLAGLLGIPFPNGLIPQAPFHTAALCVTKQRRVPVTPNKTSDSTSSGEEPDQEYKLERVTDHVVEQRVSNLAQGFLTLGTMTGPLLIVVHLIPQGVLAGLFFTMGTQALSGNGIVLKLLYLCRERSLSGTAANEPMKQIKRQYVIWVFVLMELFFFGAAFAVTQTVAAIGFPIILIMPIPWRVWVMPKWFRKEELDVLDAPTASPFTMESVGGIHGAEEAPLGADVGHDRGGDGEAGGFGAGAGAGNDADADEKGIASGGGVDGKDVRLRNSGKERASNRDSEATRNGTMSDQPGYDPWKL